MKKIIFFVMILSFIPAFVYNQTKNARPVQIVTQDGKRIELYKNSYALLVGVSAYTAGWSKLPSVPGELETIDAALRETGFEVSKIIDPDDVALEKAFKDFIDQYGFEESNRLLFFFSGHGYSRRKGMMGYLVPKNAPLPRQDEKEFLRKSLSMSQILTWCREMEAKHILFLFDSCFSGTIFETKTTTDYPLHISDLISQPVRQFITAGDAGEEVPAKSVFAPCFVRGIRGEADFTKDGFVTGSELGIYLHDKVIYYKTRQTPQYGKIRDPELDEGDFVFTLSQKAPVHESKPEIPQVPQRRSESPVPVQDKPKYTFRDRSISMSIDEATIMIKRNKFFELYKNETGRGIENQFEAQAVKGDKIIFDHSAGLMWQQSGSDNFIVYDEAKKYIAGLNRDQFAGFNDWRLPTLEEAMSLMEPEKSGDLYIDPVFDGKQRGIWTSDQVTGWSAAWVVDFLYGECLNDSLLNDNSVFYYVRAVRSGQSSP